MADLRKSSATQRHRTIAVDTVLGEDVLLLQRMVGGESLGRLFEFHLDLLSTDADIDLEAALGTNVTVRYHQPKGGIRFFNGFVSEFRYVGERGNYAAYEMTLRPWLWFLTRTSDCRIFQKKTVPAIITDLFREHGFTDYEDALSGDYRQWEYCVQYRETDFDFVSRLMEQEGIYYFVKHENGKHLIVLADGYGAHDIYPNYSEIPCVPSDRPIHAEHISHFDVKKRVLPGVVALNDFNFEKPKADLKANGPKPRPHAKADYEIYDYPGEFEERSDGEGYARKRIEELHSVYEVASGRGNAAGLAVGYLFNLTDHPRRLQNREHLITDATYEMRSEEFETGGGAVGPGEQHFLVNFSTIHSQEQFRPQRITAKPTLSGPQTAIVVGKAGEEIWTDEYGRVKVQFHWDRYGAKDENSSCWIRVSQDWAGKKWGSINIPRIGQEVIVDFLEGDPDRPIITGRVYNADAMPPYELPGEKTKSTLKSNSSKGGGGFNEIRFEDKKGEEQIFVHGEKNQDIRIKNNALEWIGNDRHLIVKRKQYEQVEGEKHLIVKAGDGGSGDQFEKVEGDKHQKVQGDHNQKVEGTLSIDVDVDKQETVGVKYAMDAGVEIHIKGGTNVVIESNTTLTLKVGGNFININSGGIFIQGTMVMINSGGAAGSGAGSRPGSAQAPTAPQEADTAEPGEVSEVQAASIQPSGRSLDSTTVGDYQNPQAQTLASAAESGAPFCEICEQARRGREGQ
jgi:type VI secretion system secreted protein VgrG